MPTCVVKNDNYLFLRWLYFHIFFNGCDKSFIIKCCIFFCKQFTCIWINKSVKSNFFFRRCRVDFRLLSFFGVSSCDCCSSVKMNFVFINYFYIRVVFKFIYLFLNSSLASLLLPFGNILGRCIVYPNSRIKR